MRKSARKRVKITKRGKAIYRASGKNHFNAKEPRKIQMREKGMKRFSKTLTKKIKRYI